MSDKPNDGLGLPKWLAREDRCLNPYCESKYWAIAGLKIAWKALGKIRNRQHYTAGIALDAMRRISALGTASGANAIEELGK